MLAPSVIAQTSPPPQSTICPQTPALQRLKSHSVQSGETLPQIAQRYGLLSATLMGINPALQTRPVHPGQTLVIPPYNGIQVATAGQTLQAIAKRYNVRPDVLFEVNGCQTSPTVVFVPGVNWTPSDAKASATTLTTDLDQDFNQDRYPLPGPAAIKQAYGWQPIGVNNAIVFSSGVHLVVVGGTPVSAVADGTIAFAGPQAPWNEMVVINHSRGRQTRYGHLSNLKVKVGQQVRKGQTIGIVSNTASVLRFELRNRSSIGWIAQNPLPYLQAISKNRSN